MQSKKVCPVCRDLDINDYIGMESCVDLKENQFAAPAIRRSGSKREYPPPIPLVVRRVLKRQYTGDGRLILTEERVSHHEFFLAHRSDGRLMMQLVAFDDRASSDESNVETGDEDECPTAAEEGGGMGKCCNVDGRDAAFMFGVAVRA